MNSQRFFGLLGMMASPLFLIYVVTTGMHETTLLGSTLGLLFQLGCLACAAGLFVTRATGDSAALRGFGLCLSAACDHTLRCVDWRRARRLPLWRGLVCDLLVACFDGLSLS